MKTLLALSLLHPHTDYQRWVRQDAALELADYATSRAMLARGYVETNPLYGRRPGALRQGLTFAGLTVAGDLVAWKLAKHHPRAAQALRRGMLLGEGLCVAQNLRLITRRPYVSRVR